MQSKHWGCAQTTSPPTARFDGIGNGLEVIDSSLVFVYGSRFNGLWDANRPGLQDSQAAIWSHGHVTGLKVDHCWIAGYGPSAPVNVTSQGSSSNIVWPLVIYR